MYNWDELNHFITNCKKCTLCVNRNQVVLGKGNRRAKLFFIAEAPGKQEDLQGTPFVGPAGQLLDKLLNDVSLNRKDIYISNVVKCRPPNNRDPLSKEKNACLPFLRYEAALIQPNIIVCLGRVAAQAIINPHYKITQEHGQWIERKDCFLTSTFHPAAVLRDPDKMLDVKKDFLKIKDKYNSLL